MEPEGGVGHDDEVYCRYSGDGDGILDWEWRSWGLVVPHLFHHLWSVMWP